MGVLGFIAGLVGWLAGATGVLGFLPHWVQTGVQALGGLLGALGIRGAAQNPSEGFTRWLDHLGSGWKTLAGGVMWVIGTLASDPTLGTIVSPTVAHALATLGAILTALGLYHAVAKVKA